MALTPEQLASSGTEHGHQCAYFVALHPLVARYPGLRWAHAIPNGGERDVITSGKLKAEGVKAGVFDVFVPVPCGKWGGLYIEFKKPALRRKGREAMSDKQVEFGIDMHRHGYHTVLCFDWEEALAATLLYLEGRV